MAISVAEGGGQEKRHPGVSAIGEAMQCRGDEIQSKRCEKKSQQKAIAAAGRARTTPPMTQSSENVLPQFGPPTG